jgi:hypothetical protein
MVAVFTLDVKESKGGLVWELFSQGKNENLTLTSVVFQVSIYSTLNVQ